MKLKFRDTFTSKYRYGKLYPKGTPFGTIIHNKLQSADWELENRKDHIAEMNDNRMDRNYGFTDNYRYKITNKMVSVHCERSATGKTLDWTFSSNDIENQEEFDQLLNIALERNI